MYLKEGVCGHHRKVFLRSPSRECTLKCVLHWQAQLPPLWIYPHVGALRLYFLWTTPDNDYIIPVGCMTALIETWIWRCSKDLPTWSIFVTLFQSKDLPTPSSFLPPFLPQLLDLLHSTGSSCYPFPSNLSFSHKSLAHIFPSLCLLFGKIKLIWGTLKGLYLPNNLHHYPEQFQ